MKKLFISLMFLAVSLGAQDLIIKRDNGKIPLSYEKKDGLYILSNQKNFDDEVKVIIVYEDNKYKEEIEKKYNLSNGKDKYGMYFIYEQNSQNIVELFSKLSDEKNVKNVYPNWTTSIKKF